MGLILNELSEASSNTHIIIYPFTLETYFVLIYGNAVTHSTSEEDSRPYVYFSVSRLKSFLGNSPRLRNYHFAPSITIDIPTITPVLPAPKFEESLNNCFNQHNPSHNIDEWEKTSSV